MLAYPFSFAYRVVANATSSAVPFVVMALIAWGALQLYDGVVATIDSETFNLFVAIGLVSWVLNTMLKRAWRAIKTFFATLRNVFYAGLPPWIPGLLLREELRSSHKRLRSTVQEGFRKLFKPTRDFLGVVALAVFLFAAVKALPESDTRDRIVWVAPASDACCTKDCGPGATSCLGEDDCFAPVECALTTRGLGKGMEFVLTYPLRRPRAAELARQRTGPAWIPPKRPAASQGGGLDVLRAGPSGIADRRRIRQRPAATGMSPTTSATRSTWASPTNARRPRPRTCAD